LLGHEAVARLTRPIRSDMARNASTVTAEVGLNDSVTGEQVTRLVAELRDRLRAQGGVAEVYLTPVAP